MHPSVGPSVGYGNRTPTFVGAINRESFDRMTDHIVSRYMSQPNYLRVQTKPNGPKCTSRSIMILGTITTQVTTMQLTSPYHLRNGTVQAILLFLRILGLAPIVSCWVAVLIRFASMPQ